MTNVAGCSFLAPRALLYRSHIELLLPSEVLSRSSIFLLSSIVDTRTAAEISRRVVDTRLCADVCAFSSLKQPGLHSRTRAVGDVTSPQTRQTRTVTMKVTFKTLCVPDAVARDSRPRSRAHPATRRVGARSFPPFSRPARVRPMRIVHDEDTTVSRNVTAIPPPFGFRVRPTC